MTEEEADLRVARSFTLLQLLWLTGAIAVEARDPAPLFRRLSIEQGLSQSIVEDIAQDSTGFLWFATEDGLNRFDGYTFRHFRSEPGNPTSLSHNEIKAITEDRNGHIWVGTFASGLNRFDPSTEKVTRFAHDPNQPASLAADSIRCLFEDSTGTLWIGTQGGGLDRFDRSRQSFLHHRFDGGRPGSLSHDDVRCIFEDSAGILWIGTNGGGLNRFDRSSQSFQTFRHRADDAASLAGDAVFDLSEDEDGRLWIATYGNGLDMFDRESGQFAHYRADPEDPRSLPSDLVRTVLHDHRGRLWVGTDGGGLAFSDRPEEGFDVFRHQANDPTSLGADRVFALAEDRSRVLWVGTYGAGLSSADLSREPFGHLHHEADNPNSLNHDIVWSIFEDSSGVLWIGTDSGGLNRFDRRRTQWQHYVHDPQNPSSLGHNAVRMVIGARGGGLWLATAGGGLNGFDPHTGVFRHFRHDPAAPEASLAHDDLRHVLLDHEGMLWVSTFGGGLDRVDPRSGRILHYRHDPDDPASLSHDFVRLCFEDSRRRLWVGTHGGGLNLLDPESGAWRHYRFAADDPNSLSSDYVFSLVEGPEGRLWVGTYGGGLNLLDPESGRCVHYRHADGLASDAVFAMVEDSAGQLWISTNHGLSRFDPKTGSFRNFDAEDGLQSNEFNGGAAFASATGELFFGGINGLNYFSASDIAINPVPPTPVITELSVFNHVLAPGETFHGRVLLEHSISSCERVELEHHEKLFTIEFAGLHFAAPAKNRYRYQMAGLSNEWIPVSAARRHATFTGLPAGSYVFSVAGANSDGVWSPAPAQLRIVIRPPFWGTWWFRSMLALACAAVVATVLRSRLRGVRMRAELEAAHDAQMAIMPQTDPLLPGLELSGRCIPASEVGGDFFDYFWLEGESRRLCVAVGDVAGKAMRAAMTAVMSDGMLISRAMEGGSLAQIMTSLNQAILAKVEERMFTALCLLAIEPRTMRLTYCNAGLCEPLFKHGDRVEYLEPAGPRLPLGVMDGLRYASRELSLAPGDVVVVFSDGVVEARAPGGELWGYDAPRALLQELDCHRLGAAEIRDRLLEAVAAHARSAAQSDDKVLVVMRVVERDDPE